MYPIGARVTVETIVEKEILAAVSSQELHRMLSYVGRVGIVCEHKHDGQHGDTPSDPRHIIDFGPVRRQGRWCQDIEFFWSEELAPVPPLKAIDFSDEDF